MDINTIRDKDLFNVSNPSFGQCSITASITSKLTNIFFRLTVVYGPWEDPCKEAFLQELLNLKPPQDTPWLCIGDFNLIHSAADKNNLSLNRRLMGRFRSTLDTCELLELTLHNRKFTWSNGQLRPTLVRLDRFFYNGDWDELFPNHCLQALSSSMSDHCPLFLCSQERPPREGHFKFEHFWTKIPGFYQVVEEAWNKPVGGQNAMMILHNKLLNTASALRAWSRKVFGEARMQLHMVQKIIFRLDQAQEERDLSEEEVCLLKDLKVRVLGLAAVERARRRQCSRLTWLKSRDACTKFFHLKMTARKHRTLSLR